MDRADQRRVVARTGSAEPAERERPDVECCHPVPVPGLVHRQVGASRQPSPPGQPAASIVSTLRRYRDLRMNNDKMHPVAIADRAARNDAGFQSAANVGWIQLGTETTFSPPHIEYSLHGVAHSEERLIAWALGQGADLGLAPTAAGPTLRVKGLYTERAPCRLEDNRNGGDQPRYDRVATDRCCHAYLTRVLHGDVEVIHSVDNAPAPHELLRNEEWVKHHKAKQLRRVAQAYNAKRAILGPDQGLLDLFAEHRQAIQALQPVSLSSFQVNHHRATVTQAANAAIVAIQAYQPPVADALQGPPPGPPGPPDPPDPDGPPPGSKRAPSGDPDVPEPAAKRPLVGVT